MSDITYLNEKSKMPYDEIMNLPYGVFLSLVEQHTIQDLMQSEDGRALMEKVKRFKNPRKQADLSAIRSFGGYQKAIKKEGGD
jgi:hypothetical protein